MFALLRYFIFSLGQRLKNIIVANPAEDFDEHNVKIRNRKMSYVKLSRNKKLKAILDARNKKMLLLELEKGFKHAHELFMKDIEDKMATNYQQLSNKIDDLSNTVTTIKKVYGECLVCMDGERTHLFTPCGHLALCAKCANDGYYSCIVCREKSKRVIRLYE